MKLQYKPSLCYTRSGPAVFLLICSALLLLLSGCSRVSVFVKVPPGEKSLGECVVLLHGMGRSYRAMEGMQEKLVSSGYHTVNLGYPSTKCSVETIAEKYYPMALEQCRKFSPTAIHFVTHSLGGIVLRQALKESRPRELGRVVMLSPPNHGSVAADNLRHWWLYEWLNGPAGQQLTTADSSLPNRLGPVDYPVGVITGDRYFFFDFWLSSIIPGIDDGKVSVSSARLDGMSDFLVVHETHPFIMDSDYVQDETLYFLKNAVFQHVKPVPAPVSGVDWFSFPSTSE